MRKDMKDEKNHKDEKNSNAVLYKDYGNHGKSIKDSENDSVHEVGEDATQYGEFVSSYFAWISLPKQKERAEELDHMTKKRE